MADSTPSKDETSTIDNKGGDRIDDLSEVLEEKEEDGIIDLSLLGNLRQYRCLMRFKL